MVNKNEKVMSANVIIMRKENESNTTTISSLVKGILKMRLLVWLESACC